VLKSTRNLKEIEKAVDNLRFLLYMLASCHVARYALMCLFTFANYAGQYLYI
jgi:hypothetical protein